MMKTRSFFAVAAAISIVISVVSVAQAQPSNADALVLQNTKDTMDSASLTELNNAKPGQIFTYKCPANVASNRCIKGSFVFVSSFTDKHGVKQFNLKPVTANSQSEELA